jgi:hypothetical protein
MIRTPVNSTDLRSVGYDSSTRVLEVEFHSGGVYEYYSVPQPTYEGLMNAPSHGKYFHRYIKNVFRYRRIR